MGHLRSCGQSSAKLHIICIGSFLHIQMPFLKTLDISCDGVDDDVDGDWRTVIV